MPDIEETVYYEDVEPSAAPKASQDASDARTEPSNSQASSTAPEPTAAAAAAATRFEAQASSGQKRQRTLHDMFSGGASKKPKTVATSSSKAAASSAATTSTAVARPKAGAITLNSIPFSLSGYLQSLSEEQKELLKLECDTINLSWCVCGARLAPISLTELLRRLKVLQDEIKFVPSALRWHAQPLTPVIESRTF
jgi:uracil-DNA glycosylase